MRAIERISMTPPPIIRPAILRPEAPRSGEPSRIDRRGFLKKTAGTVASFSLGGLAACGDDDFDGPSAETWPVWIAQRVSGIVRHGATNEPIPGADVNLNMGFDPRSLIMVAQFIKTGPQGTFEFIRAEETGNPGDFWRFDLTDPSPVQVYIRLTVLHPSFQPAYPVKDFTRTPSKEEPERRLDLYDFQFVVPMNQISE